MKRILNLTIVVFAQYFICILILIAISFVSDITNLSLWAFYPILVTFGIIYSSYLADFAFKKYGFERFKQDMPFKELPEREKSVFCISSIVFIFLGIVEGIFLSEITDSLGGLLVFATCVIWVFVTRKLGFENIKKFLDFSRK